MRERWTLGIGLMFLCLALLTLFVWIPNDIESGVVEVFRRSRTIGDAMAPVVAATGIAIVSIILTAGAILDIRRQEQKDKGETGGSLTIGNAQYIAYLIVLLGVSVGLFYWLGPAVVKLASVSGVELGSYRELRGTVPWKYAGYISGGFVLVFGLISLVDQRLRWRTAAIAFVVVLAIGLLYDLPFDNLLLPPNGDY